MWIYVVIRDSAYGEVVDKIFTSKQKAENYIKDQSNPHALFQYRIEEHFAI